jgi:hypothetical protein
MGSRPDGATARLVEDGVNPTREHTTTRRHEMYHPETMYELAKLRIAEDLRQAEHERLVRRAGAGRSSGAIDSVPFKERLTRLFGTLWPSAGGGAATAGA